MYTNLMHANFRSRLYDAWFNKKLLNKNVHYNKR